MKIDYTKKQALFLTADKPLVDFLLSLNTNNRNIRKRHVNWLMETIKNDEFMVTGQPIIVTKDGILIDGQHRLLAIQKLGYKPVDLMLVTGIDPKAQMYLDQHAKRGLRDVLKLTYDKDINKGFSGLVTFMQNYHEHKDGTFDIDHKTPLIKKVLDYSEKHGKNIERILDACGGKIRVSTVSAIYIFGMKYGWDEASRFGLQVRDGENLTKQDPAYQLREYLERNRHGGSQASEEAFKMTVGACTVFAQEKKIERLRPLSSWAGLPQ